MVCRARRDDADLVRVGRGTDGAWYVGRGVGRGVWWCGGSDCGLRVEVRHVARAMRSAVSESDVVAIRVLEGARRGGERQ